MSFPTFSFDPSEVSRGEPLPASVDRVFDLFREHGAVRLHNLFRREFLEELEQHYRARYRYELAGTKKKDRRPLYTVDVQGPIASPEYFCNPLLRPILERTLGEDFVLGACSTVISFPGAPEQFIHRDSASLFGDFRVDIELPTYACTVLIPLVDANTETGSTRVWPGTHRIADLAQAKEMPSESPDVPFGSVLMTDSRVVHCGSPNRSQRIRPLLYNTYHRAWFRDWGGYEVRPPVNVDALTRFQVPEQYWPLFRIGDESAGRPEGPRAPARHLTQALPAPARRILERVWPARTP